LRVRVEIRLVKKFLVFAVAGLLLMGASGGGVWFWMHRAQAAAPAADGNNATEKQEEPPDPADSGVLAMDPFLVNLADAESPRFLRATLSLVVATKQQAEHLTEDEVAKARIRSAILELLTTQQSAALVTPAGKAQLKTAISERASKVLGDARVIDVLFSDFVVQF
jgi:flagellar protein FliL